MQGFSLNAEQIAALPEGLRNRIAKLAQSVEKKLTGTKALQVKDSSITLEAFVANGEYETFKSMPLSSFARCVKTPHVKLTEQEAAAFTAQLLGALPQGKENAVGFVNVVADFGTFPGLTSTQIVPRIRKELAVLREKRKVSTVGEKTKMVYYATRR